MAFTNQCHYICLATLFILGIWASQASCRPLPAEQSMMERHEQWMARHGRVYKDPAEKEKRYMIFKDNVEGIDAFNQGMDLGYKLSVNQFAELTKEEFLASYTGYKRQSSQVIPPSEAPYFKYANVTDAPSSVDWRKEGAVTPIKDQGKCGCCWAFSAVAAVEGITKIKSGQLVSLSEQELADCDTTDHGCEGGYINTAFQFIQQNQGLTTETDYPYKGVDGTCNTNKTTSNAAATITGYENVTKNSEAALLTAVANQPVSVAVDASKLQFYSSGIFTDRECGTSLNHAVVAIGYDVSENGTNYWLLKNSWGTEWGESGYMSLQRGIDASEGLCGIAMDASYPTA